MQRIWYFYSGGRRGGDVDMVIGHGGRNEQFKILVNEIGPVALRLRVVHWVRGAASAVWDRVGHLHIEPDQHASVVTLPVR